MKDKILRLSLKDLCGPSGPVVLLRERRIAKLREELVADALDQLEHPPAITLSRIAKVCSPSLSEWVTDRKNSRQMPHRMKTAGYVPHRNAAAKDGLWKLGGNRQVVYVREELLVRDRETAVARLVSEVNDPTTAEHSSTRSPK